MFESMFKRQSIRSYKMEKSDQMRLEIQNVIDDLLPLGKSVIYMDLIETEAGDKKAWAPYYVFIRTNRNDVDGDAVGFKGEQMVLKLASMGYGTCWQVGSGPRMPKIQDEINMVKIAIGKPDGELFRKSVDEFKRIPSEEMSGGDCDKTIVDAVRLAPSAMNMQPWYIFGNGDQIHIYRRKCAGPLYLEKITSMDIGIAMCHIDVAAKHLGFSVSYANKEHPDIVGKKYVTTVLLH